MSEFGHGLAVIDWIIMAVLLVSTLISIKRGFVKEALSLATWVAAIIVSRLFASQVSTLLVGAIEMPSMRLGVAYGLLFVGTLIVGALLNNLIGEAGKITGLGGTDQFLGLFRGFAGSSVVIVGVLYGLYAVELLDKDYLL